MDCCTGQVIEVGVLVELVKDGAGAVLCVGGAEDGNRVRWEGFGEGVTALGVFEGGDATGHCRRFIRCLPRHCGMSWRGTFAWRKQVRMCLVHRLAELEVCGRDDFMLVSPQERL